MNKTSHRILAAAVAATVLGGLLLFWLWRDTAPISAARADNTPRCGDGVVNAPAEQCDGTEFRANQDPDARCGSNCRIVDEENRCGNAKLDPFEECDGALFRTREAPGATCDSDCAVIRPATAGPTCGDGAINQPSEQCDGKTIPETAPVGARCSRNCTLIEPEQNECQECVERSCAAQRAEVDDHIGEAGPILECVLGKDWARWGDLPAKTCAKEDLLTCYCGTTPGQDCASAAPSALSGPCVPEILVATDCTTSQCVAGRFMKSENANGKAMQYVMCEQDNCYEACF
jgi:hypothetical protein